LGFWIAHASLAGLPALSAPIGHTPGGCRSARRSSAPQEDDTAITFAELAAESSAGSRR
jgi:amidase